MRWISDLEKGLRPVDEHDFMTAFEIEGHPDLHVTHHYFRDLTPDQIKQLSGMFQEHFARNPLQGQHIGFSKPEMFGKDKDIRVLVNDGLANKLEPELKAKLSQIAPPSFPTYRPHVTSDTHDRVEGRIKSFYFQQGNGVVHFKTDAKMEKAMPSHNTSKIERTEVRTPKIGVETQKTNIKPPSAPSAVAPVPPKASSTAPRINNSPMEKASPTPTLDYSQMKKQPLKTPTLDYSQWQKPTDSQTGTVKPTHNPIQMTVKGIPQMNKADNSFSVNPSAVQDPNSAAPGTLDTAFERMMQKYPEIKAKIIAHKQGSAQPEGAPSAPAPQEEETSYAQPTPEDIEKEKARRQAIWAQHTKDFPKKYGNGPTPPMPEGAYKSMDKCDNTMGTGKVERLAKLRKFLSNDMYKSAWREKISKAMPVYTRD